MGFKIVYTKPFNKYLRDLLQQGHRKAVQAVRAAATEAGMDGEIKSLPRTKHGETRIPDVEKYDLSDGYRLVVQLVDGAAKTRAFLFVGSHDEAQRWLDTHRGYRWVKNVSDGTLEFVQVTERADERFIPADRVDLDSPEDLLALPLLRVLSEKDWDGLALSEPAFQLARSVSGSDYERDADGVLTRLQELDGSEKANLVWDLLYHAHAGEWTEFHQRLGVLKGEATIAAPQEVATAMGATENSESFITFDDQEALSSFFEKHTLADWMLFLHPEQKKLVERDFLGPARLRGVSGSGKTCVLVHRARYLAKKYRQRVLLVTLTESMRKLLGQLIDDLCGVERDLIETATMSALAKQVIHELHPRSSAFYTLLRRDRQEDILSAVVASVRGHRDVGRTPFRSMSDETLRDFLRDEISFVRGRLRSSELEQYVDAQSFQRRGRGLPLNEVSRRVVLDGIHLYEQELSGAHVLDPEGIVAEALALIEHDSAGFVRFRSVLCDEVQDLSQLELTLLAHLPTSSGEQMSLAENGLFLSGDGAQSIYKRGFTLRRIGIDVSSRSFSLRKNYRNTYEILRAAFGLVAKYEFADVDEDNIVRPSEPDFAKRHGARPLIVKCSSPADEADVVSGEIVSLLATGYTPGQVCVVGASQLMREKVQAALTSAKVRWTNLKEDADFESDRVKISTIESAKGHEFGTVFIMGLVEGVLPFADVTAEELPREAARFYVAMTRARETLTITYSPWLGYPASRFLSAIQTDCDEAHFRDGRLKPLT